MRPAEGGVQGTTLGLPGDRKQSGTSHREHSRHSTQLGMKYRWENNGLVIRLCKGVCNEAHTV
jgi:hypothetical protein